MDVEQVLRGTGAVREFLDDPVAPELLYAILDDARFAPSGGNRQAWHVTVIEDIELRRAVRDLYLDAWHDYVAHGLEGLVAFSPTASAAERRRAEQRRGEAEALSRPEGFAERLHEVPVLLAVSVDLTQLAATDRDLERYTLVGGASIYPFVWSILLAARARGLGGVMTTVATRHEPEVAPLIGLGPREALAALVALGHPARLATRLRRRPVESFTTIDRADGRPWGV